MKNTSYQQGRKSILAMLISAAIAHAASFSGALSFHVSDSSVAVVPEPSDLLLTAIGLAAMMLVFRQRGRTVVPRECERESLIGLAT